METTFKTEVIKDLKNKKVTIKREFDAPVDLVWRTWTESKLLDQWWAPKPWVAKTKYLKFEEGGTWLYAMTGPDGTDIWCIVEFKSIKKNSRFRATSFFCDENGNKSAGSPSMLWENVFIPEGMNTKLEVEISFTEEKDLQQIIQMGFEAGFTAALSNLDELLDSKTL